MCANLSLQSKGRSHQMKILYNIVLQIIEIEYLSRKITTSLATI